MPRCNFFLLSMAARLCVILLPLAQCVAADPMTAELLDGREVSGVIDVKTDSDQLWIRRDEAHFSLISGFPWNQVRRGQIREQTLDRNALKAWALEHKQVGRLLLELESSTDSQQEQAATDPRFTSIESPVSSLAIESYLANWDSDAQSDGLRVFVSPLDSHGRIVPINGQIEYTLVVEEEKINGGQSGSLRPVFRELDRGSFVVRREHFSQGPAVYELPFNQQHPDIALNIATEALLHVRLGISGQGVFEASDAQVCLREKSRFRDQLQYYTPHRYLNIESGGKPQR